MLTSAVALFTGAITGYLCFPLLHTSATAPFSALDSMSRKVVVCELSSEQIAHLSAQIAPEVVKNLATSGLNGVAPDPRVAEQQRQAMERSKMQQAAAFSQATQLVDHMIASRQITPDGLKEARRMLRQTGQSDQAYLLNARIAAAINRHELTPEQAGLAIPANTEQ